MNKKLFSFGFLLLVAASVSIQAATLNILQGFDPNNPQHRTNLQQYLIVTPEPFEDINVLRATELAAAREISIITGNREVQEDWFRARDAHCTACTLDGIEVGPGGVVNARFSTSRGSVTVENFGNIGIVTASNSEVSALGANVAQGTIRQGSGRVEILGTPEQQAIARVSGSNNARFSLTEGQIQVNSQYDTGAIERTTISAGSQVTNLVVNRGQVSIEGGQFRVVREATIDGQPISLTLYGSGSLQFRTQLVNGVATPIVNIGQGTVINVPQGDGTVRRLNIQSGTVTFTDLMSRINACVENCVGVGRRDRAEIDVNGILPGTELALDIGSAQTVRVVDIRGPSDIVINAPSIPLLTTASIQDGALVRFFTGGGTWNLDGGHIGFRNRPGFFTGSTEVDYSGDRFQILWNMNGNGVQIGDASEPYGWLTNTPSGSQFERSVFS